MPANSLTLDFLRNRTVPVGAYAKLELAFSDYEGLDANFLRSEFPGNKIVEALIKKYQNK